MTFITGVLLGLIGGFVTGFVLTAYCLRVSCQKSCVHPEQVYNSNTGCCLHCGKRICI